MNSCFYTLRDDVLHAISSGERMPVQAFESELLRCFTLGPLEGFYALSHVLVETPGMEQYASSASRALTAWQHSVDAIHAARKP